MDHDGSLSDIGIAATSTPNHNGAPGLPFHNHTQTYAHKGVPQITDLM